MLYEKATGGTLVLTASVSTYLLSISRKPLAGQARVAAQLLPSEGLADELATDVADEPAAANLAFAVLDYVE